MLDIVKNAAYSVFELLFLTQAGFKIFSANSVTWYISALLLVMAFYFPFLAKEKRRNVFLFLIAPLLTIFIYGYALTNFGKGFHGPSISVGLINKGLLRGFAEVALGCVCWVVARKLRELKAKKLLRLLLSIVALACYVFVFWAANLEVKTELDTLMTLALATGVSISFSEQTIWNDFLSKPAFPWLGIFSFDLYLSHGFWSRAMRKIFPLMPYEQLLIVYLAISFITACIVMFLSKWILGVWPSFTGWLRTKMLYEVESKVEE